MKTQAKGFTLLEMLVAMTLLAVIMVVLAQVFQASNAAWTGGVRQVEMSMEGRSLLGLISRELSQAIADDARPFEIQPGSLEFYTMAIPRNDDRGYRRVRYTWAGNTIRRSEWRYLRDGTAESLAANVSLLQGPNLSFSVETPEPFGTYGILLPEWVGMQLNMQSDAPLAAIRAWSFGPDGDEGTLDDITSWRRQ